MLERRAARAAQTHTRTHTTLHQTHVPKTQNVGSHSRRAAGVFKSPAWTGFYNTVSKSEKGTPATFISNAEGLTVDADAL